MKAFLKRWYSEFKTDKKSRLALETSVTSDVSERSFWDAWLEAHEEECELEEHERHNNTLSSYDDANRY